MQKLWYNPSVKLCRIVGRDCSMKKSEPFNRKIFAMLIEKAKGDRSSKQFAADFGISYVQLHKLELQAQPGAPGMKLITKLAANSAGGIELEDYLLAAGKTQKPDQAPVKKKKSLNIQKMYENLSAGQQKTVYDFMDYLANYKK